ncbi:MAG: VTT domain-containing protein [Bacteroidales bacterium]
MESILLNIVSPDTIGWLRESVVIFFLTFIHEDAAILAAGFAKVEHGLPLIYAYAPVYIGIVCGDVLIYGMGRMAQTNKWLKSKIIGPKVERVKVWLESHLVRVLVVCRLTPGLLFPTFVACGWFKIPFWRFTTVSILAGAVYSSIVLTIVILFGHLVLFHLGYWAWATLAVIVILVTVRNSRKARWSKATEQAMGDLPPSFFEVIRRYMPTRKHVFSGMPSLKDLKKYVSTAERIPNSILYIPVGLRWLMLAIRYRSITLPTVSNPMIETGGFMGESKASVLDMVGEDLRDWVSEFVILHRNGDLPDEQLKNAEAMMQGKSLTYPIVAKPDIGWNGYGVQLVEDKVQLVKYITAFPEGESFLLQRPVLHDGEAGIFYVRIPGEENGRIYSITLRYFPFVVGNGKSTLRQLIHNDERTKLRADFYLGEKGNHLGFGKDDLEHVPAEGELIRLAFIGSLRVGGLYRDAGYLITPALTERFDTIARSMPEFYYGRFDIRFESTDLLKEGKGFKIIEINGAGAEAIQAWDPDVPLKKLYSEFFRAQSLLFRVAALNRQRGYKPMPLKAFLKAIKRQNHLIPNYPAAG